MAESYSGMTFMLNMWFFDMRKRDKETNGDGVRAEMGEICACVMQILAILSLMDEYFMG